MLTLELTVSAAEALVTTVPHALVTAHDHNEPLSTAVTPVSVRLVVPEPLIEPPSETGLPFFNHWAIGAEPFATVTEKVVFPEVQTVCADGVDTVIVGHVMFMLLKKSTSSNVLG